jgi:hypothetical protein
MRIKFSWNRFWATLLALGAGFLIYRTIWLIAHGYLVKYTWWVAVLLVAEMLVDIACLFSIIRWWIFSGSMTARRLALRMMVAVVILHALRVAIFVMGCVGPWIAWDLRPEYRVDHASGWTWTGFWIASTGAAASLLAVLAVWLVMRRKRRKLQETNE